MGTQRQASLDGLRTIAALTVFLGHAFALSAGFTRVTFAGVTMFFVLSGYLLYRPFVKAARLGKSITLACTSCVESFA